MKKLLRIVFVTNNYTPYSGGVVSSINATAAQLRALGHTVFIVTLNFLGDDHDDPSHVFRVPTSARFMYKNNHMAVPLRADYHVKHFIEQCEADIVHSHHPVLLGSSALKAARELGLPCVFTYHTLYEKYTHYVPLPDAVVRPVVQATVKSYCDSVDHIVAPSSFVHEHIKASEVTTPVSIVPSPLQKMFMPSVTFAPRRANKPFQLLFVSRFAKEKNIPLLLQMFAQLPQDTFALTLIGYGPEYEALRSYAYDELRLAPSAVQFIRKPARKVIAHWYRTADCFVFSSTTETQGLVLAEAMAGGLPVIAVDGPGQRDIVVRGENGFIVDDAQVMREMVTRIAGDSTLHAKLQRGAWKTAQEYAPSCLVKKLCACYDALMAAAHSRL